MLRRILGRRWKYWMRLFLLLFIFFLIKNYLMDLLPSFDSVDNSKVIARREFNLWGSDETDLNWMPSLLEKRTQEIPVVVVEEHYEVLKYWFQAADLGVIPMSKNILIHIDGHVDGAVPFEVDIIPHFHYPRSQQEIHKMMQRNDMFIVAAALTGLIDHVIWVWPDWDAGDHDSTMQKHVVIDVEAGYMEIKVPWEGSIHHQDLCACWSIRDTGTNKKEGLSSWECHRRNFSEIEAENGLVISRSDCQIHSSGIFEVVKESDAVAEFRKFKPSRKNVGIILDIDEDFYGCWSDMIGLNKVEIPEEDVTLISDLVADLFLGFSADEEQLADEFYSALIHLVINLKSQSCVFKEQGQSEKKNCLTNVEVSNYLIENVPNILTFLHESNGGHILRLKDTKEAGLYLQSLLIFFQNYSVKQLKVLAGLGICFTLSPLSPNFENDGKFHVCLGENVPNSTMVTFHLPTEHEITLRTYNLRNILSSVYQKPSLVTVCRSVRDGYTPKQFFSAIESDVLQSVAFAYRGIRFDNIHFDSGLLGGDFGWPHRPQSWSHKLLQYLSLHGISNS